MGNPRPINSLCDSTLVHGYADDLVVIGGETIEAIAKARNLGVKGNGLDAALPEEQEKDRGVIPEPQTWLLQELEGRIHALEEKLASQENGIQKIGRGLKALGEHKDERDKIMIRFFKMRKKTSRSGLI